ncbi:hypothetical protein ACV07N_12285, partial [Roseivirga echinicomitans]
VKDVSLSKMESFSGLLNVLDNNNQMVYAKKMDNGKLLDAPLSLNSDFSNGNIENRMVEGCETVATYHYIDRYLLYDGAFVFQYSDLVGISYETECNLEYLPDLDLGGGGGSGTYFSSNGGGPYEDCEDPSTGCVYNVETKLINLEEELARKAAESIIENTQDPRQKMVAQLDYLKNFGGEEGKAMADLINDVINIPGLTVAEAFEIYAFADKAYKNLKGQYMMSIFSVDNVAIILSFGITNNLSTAARQKLQSAISRYASNTSNIALRPLGLGSTGRVVANSLTEQLVMKEIMSNPSMGRVIQTGPNDARWLGWSKMAWNNAGIEIHYVGKFVNGVLEAVDDFKFIL